MKMRKRGLFMLAIMALVALAVAVPVVASVMATPGATGTLNFVNVNQYANPDDPPAPDPSGPAGTMAFTASVLVTGSPEAPNEFVSYKFSAVRLCKNTSYTLVNPAFIIADPNHLRVNVLASGVTNRAGVLCIKGRATLGYGADHLMQFDGTVWASGARFQLVKSEDVHESDDSWIERSDAVLFSVLGVPLVFPDNWGED
jgi:hypothetical protein